MSRTILTSVIGVLLLLVASPRDASANCQNGSTAQSIPNTTSGATLASIMAASTAPCTLNVAPGTYVAPAGTGYVIASGITVRGTGGAAATVLWVTPPLFSAMTISPVNGSCPSGATLDGLTISGGAWGILAMADAQHPGCPLNQLTGITLRNLVVNTGPGQGHAIDFHAVQKSVIDSCYINSAYGNGIFIELGSNNNIVMNNTIAGSFTQHAIAVQSSNDNTIVGNTIAVSTSFDGIILNSGVGLDGPGSVRNRIERNTISGHKVDGIVLTDSSNSNYVGLNTAVSDAYQPGSSNPPSRAGGTGIWVNNASNSNYLFGNDLSGSPENGIDVLASKSTLVTGNTVHGNYQGGVWVAYALLVASPSAPVPQDTVLQGNNVFFNTSRQVFFQNTINSHASFNYLSGAQSGVVASTGTVGFDVDQTASASIFENTVSEVWSRAYVHGSTSNALFFRNRFLKGTNNPYPSDGLNGLTFSLVPADVRWDAWSFLGGNYWSEFGAAGNPDLSHPYIGFVGNTNGAPYADRFPFASETLQTTDIPNSMTVVEPAAGAALAAQTRKTVRWIGRGCSSVNIFYGSGASAPTLIAFKYPNTGYYIWSVPAVAFRSDYYIHVQCADSNGTFLGVAGTSANFTIATNALILLTPGRAARATDGGSLRVAWKASAGVAGVNVFIKAGAGAEIPVASNIVGTNFVDVVLPAAVWSSSAVTVRIQGSGNAAQQDSVDGSFMVRGGSPSFQASLTNASLQIGSVQVLQWNGPSNSYTVDLDLISGYSISIARNLPDYGSFTWLVPDAVAANARIHATFKDESGAVVGAIDSGTFSVVRAPGAAFPPARNRSAARRDGDGDGKTDLVVFRPSNGLWYVRYSSLGYSTAAPGVFAWGMAGDVPVSGDFDGDGKIELTVFRPSEGMWYIRYSSQNYGGATGAIRWGALGDVPVAGDFDGDGRTDITVFRPSSGLWYILYSSRGYSTAVPGVFAWGMFGDLPVVCDFDGDGKTDLTVFRPSNGTWYVLYSSAGYSASNYGAAQWGQSGDVPIPGDFDGDGLNDLAVFRPSSGGWYIRYSTLGYSFANWSAFYWGQPGDVPIAGEFDGDGKADISVFRPSTGQWLVLYSTSGYSNGTSGTGVWGSAGDLAPN